MFTQNILLLLLLLASSSCYVMASTEEQRILNCPVRDGVSYSDCDIVGYGARVALVSAPGIVIALIILLIIPFFYCARYCCKCCGSNRQTDGCCCACGDTPAARYSFFEIARVKIYAVICGVMGIVCLAYSMSAASQGRNGITDLLNAIGLVPEVLVDEIDLLTAKLTVTFYNSTSDSFTTSNLLNDSSVGKTLNSDIRKVADDMKKTIKDGTSLVDSQIDTVMNVLFVIVLIPAICMILNVVFAFFNLRKWGPMLNSLAIFFFSAILWITHSGLSAVGIVLADVCAEVKGLANQQRNVVTSLISCPSGLLDSARSNFKTLEADQAKSACEKMNSTCVIPTDNNTEFIEGAAQGRVYNCPAGFLQCENATFALLLDYSDNSMIMNSSVYDIANASQDGLTCRGVAASSCSLGKCAYTCTYANGTRSIIGKTSAVAYTAFLAAATVANVFADIGAKFYVCESLLSLVTSKMASPCDALSDGFYDIRMSTGIECIFCIFAVFVCSWGSKRFIPFSEAGKFQRGDDWEERQRKLESQTATTNADTGAFPWSTEQNQ